MATKFLSRYKFGANISVRRAFRAYKVKEYEAMFNSLKHVKPVNFITNKEEDMSILHDAAYKGDFECIDVLKELPYFEEIINDNTNVHEWTPLLWATAKNNFGMVKKLYKLGGNMIKPKKDGLTCLHISATNNNVHILNYLLENRPTKSIDIENAEGWTPAHFAAFMNAYDSLNLLIEHGANLWHKHQHNHDVFEEIIRSNDENFLGCVYDIYTSKKRDLTQKQSYSLMHLAAGTDAFKIVEFLASQGENINQICNYKDKATPLHFAMLSNNFSSGKILLKWGAKPNLQDNLGNTPYHFAVTSKNRQLLQLLEDHKGNALIENHDGMNAIDLAGIENIRAAKLFFLNYPKYKTFMAENGY
ncbi:unnamed protein product [Moneuplotes crassus]|uniref:Ankyrin repeat protein n=1 Tax=Euplotes crassus TaxID=5936 RepID=A0AAD1XKI7_EUPCR|nr:unnamed protein product [Moneuplotes crassus]